LLSRDTGSLIGSDGFRYYPAANRLNITARSSKRSRKELVKILLEVQNSVFLKIAEGLRKFQICKTKLAQKTMRQRI